jgi:biopolymer transport protein ExbD
MARNKRAIPEINAGSMADIAFLLLIFFLVTTTMDVDRGIARKLPPLDEENTNPPPIKKKNIFTVLVNSNNQLFVEEDYMDLSELREAAIEFLDNNGDGSCKPCKGSRDDSSSDNPDKAVISITTDRGTSYKTFIAVQNELTAAYNELRNRMARDLYGKKFDDLDDERKKIVQDTYPMKISEAEPLKIGG